MTDYVDTEAGIFKVIMEGNTLKSTLIKFTSNEYADSYKTGNLYLSSLSTFWDFAAGTIRYDGFCSGKVSKQEFDLAIANRSKKQMDFSEGVIAQIRRDKVSFLFGELGKHIIHDVRFRLSAYKYCNLLCFFRIDAEDGDNGCLDEENAALILQKRGMRITAAQLNAMPSLDAQCLVESVIPKNEKLSKQKTHLVQLPDLTMDAFGDMVVVIKDESEFKKRVLAAVKKFGDRCIMGDVRYHRLMDRANSGTMGRRYATIVSSSPIEVKDKNCVKHDGAYSLSSFEDVISKPDAIWRGCLDKYDNFGAQREWRICWLPKERNHEAKILPVGSLEDVVDLVKTEDIRTYLLERYKGYLPGIVAGRRKDFLGTDSYKAFNDYMKSIDGLGDFIIDISYILKEVSGQCCLRK